MLIIISLDCQCLFVCMDPTSVTGKLDFISHDAKGVMFAWLQSRCPCLSYFEVMLYCVIKSKNTNVDASCN